MSDLFKPKNQKELDDIIHEEYVPDDPWEVLVFSSVDQLYVLENLTSHPVRIKTHAGLSGIHSLAYANDNLYYASDNKIYDALSSNIMRTRNGRVKIYSKNGVMYDFGHSGKVMDTLNEQIILDFGYDVEAFCMADNGETYIADQNGFIYSQVALKSLRPRTGVMQLFSYSDNVYDAYKNIRDSNTNDTVGTRNSLVTGFADLNGILYDSGMDGRIHNTISDYEVYNASMRIDAMIAIPKEFVEDFL